MNIFMAKYNDGEEKVNFADENNSFVGYSLAQKCCERAGFFFSDCPEPSHQDMGKWDERLSDRGQLPLWLYGFEIPIQPVKAHLPVQGEDDFCTVVTFKLTREEKDEPLYLHLYNIHNGYYYHTYEIGVIECKVASEDKI